MSFDPPQYRVGVDVGGTFTDIVLMEDGGEVHVKKVLSTPGDYANAIVSGLRELLAEVGIAAGDIREVCHGSTAATNAVLERKGATVGLITTQGFRDVLELRRLRVPILYDQFYRPPEPLVPRSLRTEVVERMDTHGNPIIPPDREQVQQVIQALTANGVNSIAVCLLNSYVNPDHERLIGEVIRQQYPDTFVSLSCDVAPGVGEYERTSTVVANAYVKPVMTTYLGSLKQQLVEQGATGPLFIMQSNGGMMTSRASIERPIVTLESGPAAGVSGGEFLSAHQGIPNLLIPTRLDHAAKRAGSLWMASSIQSQPASPRTRSGFDSSSVRYASTAATLSSRLGYTFPSIHRRTSSKTRSAGLSSGL